MNSDLLNRQLRDAHELEFRVSVDGVEQLTYDGRVIAEATPDGGLSYVYDGFGGPILTDSERATTVIGKFTDPDAPNGGIVYFLGNGDTVKGFPDGSIKRGEGFDAGPGDLNFLDVEAWDDMMAANVREIAADPANVGKTSDEVRDLAYDLTSEEFWVEYNLPYLEDALNRGDTIRPISAPHKTWSGLYQEELVALRGQKQLQPDGSIAKVHSLLDRYGYVWDGGQTSWVKLEGSSYGSALATPPSVRRQAERLGFIWDDTAGGWVKVSDQTYLSIADSPVEMTRPGGYADRHGLVFEETTGRWVAPAPGQHDIDHVIDGEFFKPKYSVGEGKPSGGHYLRSPKIRGVDLSPPDKYGVTRGFQARQSETTGKWIPKTNNAGQPQVNTYFPAHWTRRQTELEVNYAFRNSRPDQDNPERWVGRASDGTPITGWYADSSVGVVGGWNNAFPIYNYKGPK